jgi:hypothetical protein
VDGDIRFRELENLDKGDLYDLADGLLSCDREAIDRCFEFILAETRGVWHGRARAMMCRRLKHCEIAPERRQRLVDCIMNRLVSGDFSEAISGPASPRDTPRSRTNIQACAQMPYQKHRRNISAGSRNGSSSTRNRREEST